MSVFALKLIGVLTMLIDHLAVSLTPVLPAAVWLAMRCIGRISFPIFAFLLANGCRYTHSRKQYLLRLLLFGVLAQIPAWKVTGVVNANIMFTLALGVAIIWLIESLLAGKRQVFCGMGLVVLFVAGLYCSYGIPGIVLMVVFYFAHKHPMQLLSAAGGLWLIYSNPLLLFCALVSLVPIGLYNGSVGPSGKVVQYGFYLFYPLHLLLLWGLSAVLFR